MVVFLFQGEMGRETEDRRRVEAGASDRGQMTEDGIIYDVILTPSVVEGEGSMFRINNPDQIQFIWLSLLEAISIWILPSHFVQAQNDSRF
jgi:hypothetical protein